MKRVIRPILAAAILIGVALSVGTGTSTVGAQGGPTVVDPNLGVRTVVSGLEQPSSLAFLGPNDFLVTEKATGRVKRVVDGAVQSVLVDLSVNSASERGLLGLALHADFPTDRGVYLFWSCRATADPDGDFFPEEQVCSDAAMFGPDSNDLLRAPLAGTASTASS